LNQVGLPRDNAMHEIEQKIKDLIAESWSHRIGDRTFADWIDRRIHAEEHQDTIIRQLKEMLGGLQGQKVLDLGSGDGGLVVALRREGIDAFGIDIALDYIQVAKLRAQKYGISEDVFALYPGDVLPYADNEFDVVLSIQVFEHVPNQQAYLREAKRVLRLGGKLYIAFPNRYFYRETHTRIIGYQFLPRALQMPVLKWLRPAHYQRFQKLNIFMPHFMTPRDGLSRVRQVFPSARFVTKEFLASKVSRYWVNPLSVAIYRNLGRQTVVIANK
jgi:2-polyprenyl-3-methyl-5-hydroxy-6-metoxy-1,4-benzoquinol methylase